MAAEKHSTSGASLFPEHVVVEREVIQEALLAHWPALAFQLGETPLKQSQNTTWAATASGHVAKVGDEEGVSKTPTHIVRVTPDTGGDVYERITTELSFTAFVAAHLPKDVVCAVVPPETEQSCKGKASLAARVGSAESGAIVAVFEFARGEPVDFMEMTWLRDRKIGHAVVRFVYYSPA